MSILMNNPYVQGVIVNYIFHGMQKIVGKLRGNNDLNRQFRKSLQVSFDKLSDKYLLKETESELPLSEYLADCMLGELDADNISKDEIDKAIKDIIQRSLVIIADDKNEIEEIYNYFWHVLNSEIISHTELFRYMQSLNDEEIKQGIFGLNEKIINMMTILEFKDKGIDIEIIRNKLLDYILSLQQMYFNEIGNDIIDRRFIIDETQNKSNIVKAEIIKNGKNILILGEPGSGKTYSLRSLLYEISLTEDAEVIDKIPILLNLSVYGSAYSTILEGIYHLLRKYIIEISLDDIIKLANQGKFIILLDGLDEVNDQYYEKCINEIRDMINYNSSNKYIIACRDNVYFGELEYLVEKVKLSPLNESQISAYMEKYCGIPKYQISKEQYELFENPLLLNIGIGVIKSNNGKIPKNRCLMFNEYIDYLTYKRDKKKGLNRIKEISYYDALVFLSKIAYKKFGDPFITTHSFYKLIAEEFPTKNIDSVYDQIINMGILEYSDGMISFVHKTFKEYFAGRFIVNEIEKLEDVNILHPIINNKNWYEVFIFASGLFERWELQNSYFDYILGNNIQLYIECVKGKNDFNEYISSMGHEDYIDNYLKTFVTSYENIIEKYFPQIKFKFNPFYGNMGFNHGLKVGILGYISEDKKYFDYTLISIKDDEEKIQIVTSNKFNEYHASNCSVRFQSSFINLELSDLMGDSARAIAIKEIKGNLKSIIEERRLIENKYLLCERLEEIKHKLPFKHTKELKDMYGWINNEIEDAQNRIERKIESYRYNGVELFDLRELVRYLLSIDINYVDCLLPEGDITENVSWIWDFYSRDMLVERVSKFFYYYQISFKELIENNFIELGKYLTDYINLPYKYVVEIGFRDESIKDFFSEPELCYYYCATDSNEDIFPEIKLVEKKSSWDEQIKAIDDSFKSRKTYKRDISVANAGVTMTMHEARTGKNLPLLSNVYDQIKKNIEKVFGRF